MYDLSALTSDAQLLAGVQAGVNRKSALGLFFPVSISGLFAETTPSNVTQNSATNANDIKAAKATRISYEVKTKTEDDLRNWDGVQGKIYSALEDFNDASTLIEVGMTSSFTINYGVIQNVLRSMGILILSLILMILYSLFVLFGGCGPNRCGCNAGWVAMLTLIMSLLAGFGLASILADRIRFVAFSIMLFFVVISLGVTYMYLLSKVIDEHYFTTDDVALLMQRAME